MTTLGTSLAAFRDVALCDRLDHEVVIVTDGQRAYTYGLAGTDAGRVCRDNVLLTAACQQPTGHDGEPCDGQVTWAIDTDGRWGADGDALTLLATYGQAVER